MTIAERVPPRYLVDAVAQVSCLRDTETLRQVVHRLCPQLSPSLDTTAATSRRGVVFAVMEELSVQPAGIARLIETLEVREGNSITMRKLKVATAAWEVELLDDESWEELFDLLDGIRIPDLDRRYAEFLDTLGRFAPPLPCTEPWTVFLHAATLNARPGNQLPCFQVLQQLLALGADGERQQLIIDWAEEHDPYRPAATGRSERPPAADEGSPASEHIGVWNPSDYLMVQLRPLLDAESGRDTLLSHWLRVHPGGRIKGEDSRIDLRDAEREVATLVFHAESDMAHRRADLALEFVLPRDLLDLDVERWHKTSFQGVGGVLGEDHHVVVRSLDRLGRRDLHGRWGRRWDAFANGRAGRVHWYPEDGRSHLLSEPPPAVAVLSDPPTGARGETGARGSRDELVEALRAGVPVILWDRRGPADPVFLSALRSLLDRHDLRGLPGVVKALRIAAIDSDPENDVLVGRHVALLWDDPNRMPVASVGTSAGPPPGGEESS
ncbi:hypothetical protein OH779_32290 [Actinacidiphila glaucinigra]|uniref:VMAP-C domain-containing protein n=1 Tax=Actinacidiphila glaucinigra TaxID=235986 RepID=UPI00386D4E57